MEKKGYKGFTCRVCGGHSYEEKIVSNGIRGPGGASWIDYYFCTDCSTMFKDITKFSTTLLERTKEANAKTREDDNRLIEARVFAQYGLNDKARELLLKINTKDKDLLQEVEELKRKIETKNG